VQVFIGYGVSNDKFRKPATNKICGTIAIDPEDVMVVDVTYFDADASEEGCDLLMD
jgi:hypothetical protein